MKRRRRGGREQRKKVRWVASCSNLMRRERSPKVLVPISNSSHLLIEVKGATARLLSVAERTRFLFQKGERQTGPSRRQGEKEGCSIIPRLCGGSRRGRDDLWLGRNRNSARGETVLDRVHQVHDPFRRWTRRSAKRFLVDDGAGRDDRFWRLAQASSALYPSSTDEKRWVDGVLARKKSLGF